MQFGNDSTAARAPRTGMLLVLTIVMLLGLATARARAATVTPTPRQVTVTSSGKNQNSSIDSRGDLIVFTSDVPDAAQSTFDAGALGNDFTPPGATHPNPTCVNCDNTDANGELFLWRLKPGHNGEPANSFTQITDTSGGGFAANQLPTISQKGTVVVWDSDRDQLGTNADGNREIFLYDLKSGLITQITDTIGGGDAANRNADVTDDGTKVVFDSNRDFSGVANCVMTDGTIAVRKRRRQLRDHDVRPQDQPLYADHQHNGQRQQRQLPAARFERRTIRVVPVDRRLLGNELHDDRPVDCLRQRRRQRRDHAVRCEEQQVHPGDEHRVVRRHRRQRARRDQQEGRVHHVPVDV
jgi:hypothetical protein